MSRQHRGQRTPEGDLRQEQRNEAYHLRHFIGEWHDYIIGETIQCQTPEEVVYYLTVTYPDGLYMDAIPKSTIQGLVLSRKLLYYHMLLEPSRKSRFNDLTSITPKHGAFQ